MKISFVVPAYNEAARITGCLESIQAEVARTVDPSTGLRVHAEIIVVNNASSDNTKELALAVPGVRVVDEHRKGLNAGAPGRA